jgi:methionyl-tRNA formyltransferase
MLGPPRLQLYEFIEAYGDEVMAGEPDWIISYGHRERVSEAMLQSVDYKAINLHIGALPWNRGADPNLHAWRDGTPHGVSLHWMSPKIDQGELIAQRRIAFARPQDETLKSSYARLDAEAMALFMEYWPDIRRPYGSEHKKADRPPLHSGWDTKVKEIG